MVHPGRSSYSSLRRKDISRKRNFRTKRDKWQAFTNIYLSFITLVSFILGCKAYEERYVVSRGFIRTKDSPRPLSHISRRNLPDGFLYPLSILNDQGIYSDEVIALIKKEAFARELSVFNPFRSKFWMLDLFDSARPYGGINIHAKDQVTSKESISKILHTRGGSSESFTKVERDVKFSVKSSRPSILGAPTFGYMSFEDISRLCLDDLSIIIRYALESNREGFDSIEFMQGCSELAMQAINSIEEALRASRGSNILPARTMQFTNKIDNIGWMNGEERAKLEAEFSKSENKWGDIDALQFCVAMRIFAEWRIARQIPDGYNKYASGMKFGLKDVVKNVAKIESATFEWLERQKILQGNVSGLRSPTLRQLLEDEVNHKFHPKLPVLKDPSGAMGVLWVLRQLWFQCMTFYNLITGAPDAVQNAYKDVFDCCHRWATQKAFQMSFKTAPAVKEIYKKMNHNAIEAFAKTGSMEDVYHGNDAINASYKMSQGKPQNIVTDLDPEEEKIAFEHSFNSTNHEQEIDPEPQLNNNTTDEANTNVGNVHTPDLESVLHELATRQIKLFLKTSIPLLRDSHGLLSEFNMDDPTKV